MSYIFLNLYLRSETEFSNWIASYCPPVENAQMMDGVGIPVVLHWKATFSCSSATLVQLQSSHLRNVTGNEATSPCLLSQIMHVNIASSRLYFLIKEVSPLKKVFSDSVCQVVCLVISLDALLHKNCLN